MTSLKEFRALVKSDPDEAFRKYALSIDEVSFDWSDASAGIRSKAGPRFIEWHFEEPNTIKMFPAKSEVDSIGKRIYYLPWASKAVTKVTLNGESPRFFLTSEFSNCRFTIQYHDGLGKTVTVMHIAGDVVGEGGFAGGNIRNQLESDATEIKPVRSRRLSISKLEPGFKGSSWRKYAATTAETTYYDSRAVVFGYRQSDGGWIFYAQSKGGERGLIRLSG